MNEQLDKQLVEKYPKIFRNRYAPMNETAMCWGFSHGDGWFNIIDTLCSNIQHHLDWVNRDGEKVHQVVAVQVKEKFGTLRFYYSGGDDEISGMVRMAESMSARTCEECGNPGKVRDGGWISTLCDEHAKGREEIDSEK
jgi:hypothetical protein